MPFDVHESEPNAPFTNHERNSIIRAIKYLLMPKDLPPPPIFIPPPMKFAKVTAMKLSGGGTATDFPTDSKYLTYVTANPCADDNGGSVDTGTTLYIGFNNSTTMGEAPPNAYITAVNEIIAYIPYTGVKTFGSGGAVKLNGWVVPGRGCWPDWVRARS